MSVANLHVLHGISTPSQFISQVTDARANSNTDILVGRAAGHVDPLLVAIRGQLPEIGFTTTQLTSLLTVTGFYGADLSGGNTDLVFRRAVDKGTRALITAESHFRVRAADAFLFWTSISARHQQEATANCRVIAKWDGTNEPLVPAGAVALTGLTPSAAEFFGCGPALINNSLVSGVQEMTIDTGIVVMQVGAESEIWPTFLSVQFTDPMITIRTTELSGLAAFGLTGAAISNTTTVFLRKKLADGTNVADNVSEHVSFTVPNGIITIHEGGGGGEEGTAVFRIKPRSTNTTTAPIVVATNATLP